MANQVVVPFPGSQFRSNVEKAFSTEAWDFAGTSRRARLMSRLSTARGVVRAVFETLSYLGEARVRPPIRSLPPARSTKAAPG
jgi:hypothetical protein